MINKLLSIINTNPYKKKKPSKEGRKPHVWNMWEHTQWSDSIQWFDFEIRRITGHFKNCWTDMPSFYLADRAFKMNMPYKLEIGDELKAMMLSGRIARFKIIELEYCCDPTDMFFGTVKDVAYVDETETIAIKNEIQNKSKNSLSSFLELEG